MPFIAEAMPCSRTPKWKLRPPKLPGSKSFSPLINVSVEGAKSAEPPSRVGRTGEMAFKTLPDADRVAMGLSAELKVGIFACQPGVNSPRVYRSHSAARSGNA